MKRLYELTSTNKIFSILLPFIIYFVIHDLCQLLLTGFVNSIVAFTGEAWALANAKTLTFFVSALSLMAPIIILCFWFKWSLTEVTLEGEKVQNGFKIGNIVKASSAVWKPEYIITCFIICILAASSALFLNLVFYKIGFTQSSKAYNAVASNQYSLDLVLGIILYGILSPLAEELVFRGCMYNQLRRFFKPVLAIGLSSFFFGAYHFNIVQGIYGFYLGLLITYVYVKTEDFFMPLLFHCVANIVVYVGTYPGTNWWESNNLAGILITGITLFISLAVFVVKNRKKPFTSKKQ